MRAAAAISRATGWSLADVMGLELEDLREWCDVIADLDKG